MNKNVMECLIKALFEAQPSTQTEDPGVWKIGEKYLIRTVTVINVGRLKKVTTQELLLEDGSWVADTGRFHDCLKNGLESIDQSEIEPFVGDAIVGRGAICDAAKYSHKLPNKQK